MSSVDPSSSLRINSVTQGLTKKEASRRAKLIEASQNLLTYEESYDDLSSPYYFYPLGSNVEIGSSPHSKKLYKLTRELTRFKNHLLEAYHQPSWLSSVEEVLSLITCYRKDTRELPFHWAKQRFLAERHRGAKLSFPSGLSSAQLAYTLPEIIHEESDDEEDNEEDGYLNPWWTTCRRRIPNRIMPNTIFDRLLMFPAVYTNVFEGQGHDKQIWHEFKELNTGLREYKSKIIEVDRPIVSVVGNFVTATINDAWKKHVKKSRLNNLYGLKFMDCTFCKVRDAYRFNIFIEVTQEREHGAFMAEVLCHTSDDHWALSLVFPAHSYLYDTEKLAASYLSRLESICKAVDDLSEEKIKRLSDIYKGLGGGTFREGFTAGGELGKLGRVYGLTKKGLRSRIEEDRSRHLQSVTNSGLKQASSSQGKTELCKQASLSMEKTKLWRY